MERQHKNPAANTAASSPANSGSSSSSRSIHGSMSSAFLGVSSSTHSQSQRRSSPPLFPPPAPAPLPGLLASRGSAAASGGGSASGSSSSQFHQISPSPGTAAKRRPRPGSRLTHSLPSPFLSELSAIRRMGTNLVGDLMNTQEMTQRPLLHGHGQQEQEMRRLSSSLPMPQPHSHNHTPIPIGDLPGFPSSSQQQQALTMRGLPGFAPPPSQQQQVQPSFSSLQPLPGGNSSGFPFPLPTSQPQQMQLSSSSSTDLPSRVFSGFEPPAALQHFSTYLAPLPSGSTKSSSCSADHAQTLSHTELPPLLPSHKIRHYELPPPPPLLGQLSQSKGSSTGCQSCHRSMPTLSEEQALKQLSHLVSLWSSTESNSCNQSMGSSIEGGCQGSAAMPALVNKFDIMSIGNSSCSGRPQMPRNYGSLSAENSNPAPVVPKLILGGMDRPGLPLQLPAHGADASRSISRRGRTKEHFFSEADMEKINKDNRLKELMKTEPKRVKRYFHSWISNISCWVLCNGHAYVEYIYRSAQTFSFAYNVLNFHLFNSCIKLQGSP
jgi:hypothetical protein